MSWDLVVDSLPRLMEGAALTLQLVGLGTVFGLILAGALAALRLSGVGILNWVANVYILVFRGTPFLVQIFLIYYGLAQFAVIRDSFLWPVVRDASSCAVLALALNTAAYGAEILVGAFRAIPAGELEAAKALGFSRWQRFRRITLARAVPLALPAYGNEVILLLKGSALVSAITVMDLTGVARDLVAETFAAIEIFALTAAIYLVLVAVIGAAFRIAGGLLNPARV